MSVMLVGYGLIEVFQKPNLYGQCLTQSQMPPKVGHLEGLRVSLGH